MKHPFSESVQALKCLILNDLSSFKSFSSSDKTDILVYKWYMITQPLQTVLVVNHFLTFLLRLL